jgi:transcriptional regulator with XRE-family HTH domain
MSITDLLKLMRKRQGSKSLSDFASDVGVSVAYVSDIYNGKRTPGPKVLNSLNVERATVYKVVPLGEKTRRWK